MRVRAFLPSLLIGLIGTAAAEARMSQNVPIENGALVDIEVSSCFGAAVQGNWAPIDIKIKNNSGQPRQWRFAFASSGYTGGSRDSVTATYSITVENNSTRAIPLLVPMAMEKGTSGMGVQPFMVRTTGYGINGEAIIEMGALPYSGKTPTRFIVMSESLGTPIWSTMTSQMQSAGKDLIGSTFNPDELPEDWRGLSGVAAMWLTDWEFSRLSAGQRQAVESWVHAGGWLMLCGAKGIPADFEYAGFGQVNEPAGKPDVNEVEAVINSLPAPVTALSSTIVGSPLHAKLIAVKPDVALVGVFICFFGLVVGPINLFILCRRRRERLFWTTPLISLCASGMLMGIIAVQDGSGGHGIRGLVVCLFPRSHGEVLVQEQLSRTGLLFGSAFRMRDPVCLTQLEVSTGNEQSRTLSIEGDRYGMDWFSSRAAQAQRIVGVVPTRAEIVLVNGTDAAAGAAPVVVSSFDTILEQLVFKDARGRVWEGDHIRTGEKQSLRPAAHDAPRITLPDTISSSVQGYSASPGSFWATAEHSGHYLATLDSIKWTDTPVTYVGPVTGGQSFFP